MWAEVSMQKTIRFKKYVFKISRAYLLQKV